MKRIAIGLTALAMSAGVAFAAGMEHKIVFQVDESDPALFSLTLNNVQNVLAAYAEAGDTAKVEVVAYGPGLGMFVADSPVAQRIAAMSLEHDDVQFAACGNTIKALTKKLGHGPTLISEAVVVPAGVVRITELQEQGYAYIRP